MPKKIVIDGIIGWDTYASDLRKQLEGSKDELQVDISSPGGSVFDGLEIFNILRDYSRNTNKVTTKIIGLAASMASYIALAGDKVIAEDNAVFMVHNVWTMAVGDYRELKKEAETIEQLTNLLAKAYSKKTKKNMDEIRQMMDNETWLMGSDIFENGFADEMIGSEKKEENEDKDLLMLAKGRVNNCISTMEKSERSKNDLKKAAALIMNYEKPEIKKEPENKMEVKNMDELNLLKSENQNLKNQIDNMKAHLQFADVAPKEVLNNIKNGKAFNVECSAEYAKAQAMVEIAKLRNQDNPDSVKTENKESGETEAETSAYIAKLKARRGIK